MFDGKTALVVGGSSGIGEATARLLARKGASVVIAAPLPATDMQNAVRSIEKDGGTASAVTCDVTDRRSVEAAFDDVLARHGRLDVVVNSAGAFAPTPAFDADPALIDLLVSVNFLGGITVSLAALKAMRATGGVLVNITSTQAVLAEPGSPVYAATKAGLAHFTASLAPELRRSGIRVVALAPGATLTPMTEALADPDNPDMLAALKHYEETSSGPYGEFFQQPEQVARTIVFLASDDARGIHATSVVADQGHTSALSGRLQGGPEDDVRGGRHGERDDHRTAIGGTVHGHRRHLGGGHRRRALFRPEGKVALVTGASSGLGALPGWTGGVLQYINGYGLSRFVARARELAETYGERFTPPAPLVAKAQAGETDGADQPLVAAG